MAKRYEILKSLPAYGPMYVSVPEDNYELYSEGLPVRFFSSDDSEWVANFQTGYTKLNTAFDLEEYIVIIASGTCYIINPDKQKPIDTFGSCYNYAVQLIDGRIIMANFVELTVIENDGSHWNSERIGLDGIMISNIENNIVTGQYNEYTGKEDLEWFDFSFNIDTKETSGLPKWYNQTSLAQSTKPWWKIW